MASATDLPKLYQGVQKQSFGYKMLSTMGWKEGQGLGANHQGIKEHIKVKKKQDAFGVGAAEQAHKLRDWTTGMVGYDAILSGLKEITRSAAPSSSSDSGSDSGNTSSSSGGHSSGYDSDSDTSSDAAARASSRKAKKGGKKQQGKAKVSTGDKENSSKKKRKQTQKGDAPAPAAKRQKRSSKAAAAADSDSSASSGSDSDSSSNSDGEPAAAAAAAAAPAALSGVSRVKAATHLGRYAKRERAKTVRNYSASDLAAILGLPSSAPVVEGGEGADAWAAAAGAAAGGGNAGRDGGGSSSEDTSSSSSSGSDSDSDSDSREGSEQRLRPGTPPGSDSPPARVEQGSDAVDAKPSDRPLDAGRSADVSADAADAKAWWRSVFVKSGGSGSSLGMRPVSKAINAHGFLEDDQTNLYMQAHATATTGKQGLGRSSMPKKVAGARWQGKKTKLGSDDEDDEQQQEQQQQQQDAAADSIAAAAAAAGREQYVKNGILVILPVKKKQVQDAAAAAQQPQEQQGKTKSKKKSKKAAAVADSGEQQQADNSKQPASGKKRKQQEEAAAAAEASSKRAKKQAGKQAAEASAGPAADSAQKSNVKWAKLAARILEEAPKRRMRIQKLHKKVVAAAGYDVVAPGVDTEVLYRQMLKKLRKAEGLQVCEKYVGLS